MVLRKKVFSFFSLFFLCCPFAFAVTVIIDPGHGGKDHGGRVRYTLPKSKRGAKTAVLSEKDLTLVVSKIIHKKMRQRGFRVYLTRSYDRSVSLEDRSEMANKVNADIFISVHVNLSEQLSASGIETFYLDNHKNKVIKKLEKIENESYAGEEPIIQEIVRDLVISKTAPLSKGLAEKIHGEIERGPLKKYRRKNRGIRPGLFYVLALASRPAVLLEMGFLSHGEERRVLLSKKFQEDYAQAVVDGVDAWVKKRDRRKRELR